MKKVIITTIIVILICLALIAICSYIRDNVENKNNYTIAAELNGYTANGIILKDSNNNLWEVPDVFLLGQNKFILEIKNNELNRVLSIVWEKTEEGITNG